MKAFIKLKIFFRKHWIKFLWLGVVLVIGSIVGAATFVTYFSFDLPKISTIADYNPSVASQIISRDGVLLAEYGAERRALVKIDEIPKRVLNAFLSAEDDNFYQHKGVDYWGMVRAFVVNLRAGKVVQGGSTITQQVAKSLLSTRKRSISRKIQDFLLAQRIEKKLTKNEILYLYLNEVYLGGGNYGVKSAIQGYFGKELNQATVAEAAMVAGLLVAPGKYSPYVHPEYAKIRQHYVLGRMYKNKHITKDEYENALKENLKFINRKNQESIRAPYFTDWVRQRIIEKVGEENFLTGGYKVRTTIDYELQKNAEKYVLEGAKEVDKRQGYKGPLGHLENDQLIVDYFSTQRKKMYQEASSYFYINDKSKQIFEYDFLANEYEIIHKELNKKLEKYNQPYFYPGYFDNDPFLRVLKNNESYEAVVLKIDAQSKVVFAGIGGVTVVIPHENFKWARTREISESKQWYPPQDNPNKILKRGDIILVKITSLKTNLWQNFDKVFQKNLKLLNDKEIKSEQYLLGILDQIPEVQSSLVSMDPKTGEIIAYVGGTDFSRSQFNRAIQAKRQPGSSFKPFVYAAALERGYQPNTIIMDTPEALVGVSDGLSWKPQNYDEEFKGPVTFRNCLEQSRNIPTIKIASAIGVKNVIDFSHRVGLNAQIAQDLSLSLGTFGITLYDLVTTYSIFPNSGRMIDPKTITGIVDRNGKQIVVEENIREKDVTAAEQKELAKREKSKELGTFEEEKKSNPYLETVHGLQVYDPRLSYIMTNILKGVVRSGTAGEAKDLSPFIAGKTGTTNNYVDALFIGFSPALVTGVWIGFDDNKTMGRGETGGRSALPIWKNFMRDGLRKYGNNDFAVPPGIVFMPINKETGKVIKPGGAAFTEAFVEGKEPGKENEYKSVEEYKKKANSTLDDDEYYQNQ